MNHAFMVILLVIIVAGSWFLYQDSREAHERQARETGPSIELMD